MIILYGIKNCDTVKKARRWLEQQGLEYHFHDLREDGITPQQARDWLAELGWETLVNKRSTSWKALPAATREAMDNTAALAAILEHPTLIKRPLLDIGHERHCGFSAKTWGALFQRHTL